MHHYPTSISDHFEEETSAHARHERPCPISKAKTELGNQQDAEKCRIEDVTCEAGVITNEGGLDRTKGKSTLAVPDQVFELGGVVRCRHLEMRDH